MRVSQASYLELIQLVLFGWLCGVDSQLMQFKSCRECELLETSSQEKCVIRLSKTHTNGINETICELSEDFMAS